MSEGPRWPDRHAAVRYVWPVYTPLVTDAPGDGENGQLELPLPLEEQSGEPVVADVAEQVDTELVRSAAESFGDPWGGCATQGKPRVLEALAGPRQGDATLGDGCAATCLNCGVVVAALVLVHVGPGQWCVGTECDCPDNPWYTRESIDFSSFEEAEAAWQSGQYRRGTR